NNGNHVKVSGFTSDGNFYYAATDEGLKRIPVNDPNPANYVDWQLLSGTNGLSAGVCKNVVTVNNMVVVLKSDSLFSFNGTSWSLFYADGNKITSINATSGKIAVCHRLAGPVSKIVILNADGSEQKIIQQNGVTPFPQKAIIYNGNYWIADQFDALSKF